MGESSSYLPPIVKKVIAETKGQGVGYARDTHTPSADTGGMEETFKGQALPPEDDWIEVTPGHLVPRWAAQGSPTRDQPRTFIYPFGTPSDFTPIAVETVDKGGEYIAPEEPQP